MIWLMFRGTKVGPRSSHTEDNHYHLEISSWSSSSKRFGSVQMQPFNSFRNWHCGFLPLWSKGYFWGFHLDTKSSAKKGDFGGWRVLILGRILDFLEGKEVETWWVLCPEAVTKTQSEARLCEKKSSSIFCIISLVRRITGGVFFRKFYLTQNC